MWKPVIAIAAATLALGQGAPALAQLPPGIFAGENNYQLAPAGAYAIDPEHTAVIAKVSHLGYSLSVFRFDKAEGSLRWDPAKPEASSLSVSVQTGSIATPVAGFAAQLSGDKFLKSTTFPKASFVSSAFHQTDSSHGRVEGQFSLMGVTRPLTFDVELIGAGKGFMGHPRIGIEAKAQINPQDYGINPMLGGPIQLVIDTEFAQAS